MSKKALFGNYRPCASCEISNYVTFCIYVLPQSQTTHQTLLWKGDTLGANNRYYVLSQGGAE